MIDRQTRALCSVVVIPIVLLTGCGNRHQIAEGVIKTPAVYKIASVLPGCGCATFANATKDGIMQRLGLGYVGGKRKIHLIARLDQRQLGEQDLDPITLGTDNKAMRIGFDWAGSGDTEHYEISVYEAEGTNKGHALLPVGHYLYITNPIDISCEAPPPDCSMGALGMNVALAATSGVGAVEAHERGAFYASNGKTITLASSLTQNTTANKPVTQNTTANEPVTQNTTANKPAQAGTDLAGSCGCVVLRTSSYSVTIEVTLSGKKVGRVILPETGDTAIAYDWAGPYELDRYILTEIAGNNLREHVTIVGQLDKMSCLPDNTGSQMLISGLDIKCLFGDAQMRTALLKNLAAVASAGGTQPSAAK